MHMYYGDKYAILILKYLDGQMEQRCYNGTPAFCI